MYPYSAVISKSDVYAKSQGKPEGTQEEARGTREGPKSQGKPEGTQQEARGIRGARRSQREARRTQEKPEGNQMEAKRNPREAAGWGTQPGEGQVEVHISWLPI